MSEPLVGGPVTAIVVDLDDATPEHRRRFGAAFKKWAGSDAELRVIYTPDFFVAVSNDERCGYVFDDTWTVECGIERGVREFMLQLESEFAGSARSAYSTHVAADRANLFGLIPLALEKGELAAPHQEH